MQTNSYLRRTLGMLMVLPSCFLLSSAVAQPKPFPEPFTFAAGSCSVLVRGPNGGFDQARLLTNVGYLKGEVKDRNLDADLKKILLDELFQTCLNTGGVCRANETSCHIRVDKEKGGPTCEQLANEANKKPAGDKGKVVFKKWMRQLPAFWTATSFSKAFKYGSGFSPRTDTLWIVTGFGSRLRYIDAFDKADIRVQAVTAALNTLSTRLFDGMTNDRRLVKIARQMVFDTGILLPPNVLPTQARIYKAVYTLSQRAGYFERKDREENTTISTYSCIKKICPLPQSQSCDLPPSGPSGYLNGCPYYEVQGTPKEGLCPTKCDVAKALDDKVALLNCDGVCIAGLDTVTGKCVAPTHTPTPEPVICKRSRDGGSLDCNPAPSPTPEAIKPTSTPTERPNAIPTSTQSAIATATTGPKITSATPTQETPTPAIATPTPTPFPQLTSTPATVF